MPSHSDAPGEIVARDVASFFDGLMANALGSPNGI
jgi:hypothetical protein